MVLAAASAGFEYMNKYLGFPGQEAVNPRVNGTRLPTPWKTRILGKLSLKLTQTVWPSLSFPLCCHNPGRSRLLYSLQKPSLPCSVAHWDSEPQERRRTTLERIPGPEHRGIPVRVHLHMKGPFLLGWLCRVPKSSPSGTEAPSPAPSHSPSCSSLRRRNPTLQKAWGVARLPGAQLGPGG